MPGPSPVDVLLDELDAAVRAAGLTRTEVARRMGSAQQTVSEVFTGAGNPTLGYLRRMWTAITAGPPSQP